MEKTEDKITIEQQMKTSLESVTDPELKKILTNVIHNIGQSPAQNEVNELKKQILKAPIKDDQKIMAFLPHQMAKTSIFFPMSDSELKEENRKINRIEQETGWGKIAIEGIKLAIFEEDIFLALLKLAKDNIKPTNGDFILHTNIKAIINILYGSKSYTKKTYDRIESTLQHFQLIRFEITTYDWKKRWKERQKTGVVTSIGGIIQKFKYDKSTKELTIKFNDDFFAYFLESMLTNINFTIRRQLKKDGAKALLRFLSTHTNPDKMHMLTVLNAINYNIDQPMYLLRRRFKQFIAELKKYGILGSKTKLYKDDVVYFDVVPSKPKISG
jgi:hypothetical protein